MTTHGYGYVPSWPRRNKGLVALLAVVGLLAGVSAAVLVSRSPGPSAFLASNSSVVEFITWQPVGNSIQGTIAYDSITGTAPAETVSVQSTPFTGSINGSTVSMSINGGFLVGTRTLTATLNGGTLTLSLIGSSGALLTDVLTQSSASTYNAAVSALHRRANHTNVLAAQAQAAQQRQQQANQDEQTAQNDLGTLQHDANFGGDLSALAGDVKQTGKDLGTVQSDASHGNGQYCDNLIQVGDDAITVDDDAISLSDDLLTLTDDFHTVHGDIATLQGDLATLSGNGLAPPAGAGSAISAAHTAITQAKATANADITQVDNDDSQAFAIGDNMATGSCSGQGPGRPSSLVPHIH